MAHTIQMGLLHMAPHRYRLEYEEGKQPCLARILAQDESAHRAMVLCVVGVQLGQDGRATLEVCSAV